MKGLEPCPACHSNATLRIHNQGDTMAIRCFECHRDGPSSDTFTDDFSKAIATATAKRRWNRAAKKAATP